MVAEVARCVFECDQGAGTHLAVSLATGGETQGLCALDFAGGSAPRTPWGASPPADASANLVSPASARISTLQRWPQCQAGSHTCMHVPA